MYCKKCGKKINDGARFCPSCGVMITKNRPTTDLTQRIIPTVKDPYAGGKQPDDTVDPDTGSVTSSKQDASKIILIAVCSVIILGLIAAVTAVAVGYFKKNKANTDEGDNIIDWETIDSVSAGFEQTQSEYTQDGYLIPEYFADAVISAAEYAQGLVGNGIAESVQLSETGCISVQLTCGETYIYMPKLEGTLSGGGSGQILTYEPCDDVADGTVDKVAISLAESDGYFFEDNNNYDSEDITNIESIKKIKNASVVLFLTHGCCVKDEIYLSLGEHFDREELNKLDKSQYALANHGICVTSAFFDKQFGRGDFEGTVFYIGACQSGKQSKLADVLIKKGTSVVYAPSDTCSLRYAKNMMSAIFGNMKQGLSAKDSLSEAKKECGSTDSRITGISEINDGYILEGCRIFLNPAEIKLFGDKNKYLTDRSEKVNIDTADTDKTDPETTLNVGVSSVAATTQSLLEGETAEGLSLQNKLWEQHIRQKDGRPIQYNGFSYEIDSYEGLIRVPENMKRSARKTVTEDEIVSDFYILGDRIYYYTPNDNYYSGTAAYDENYQVTDCFDLVRCGLDGQNREIVYSGIGQINTVLDFYPDFLLTDDYVYIVGITSAHGYNTTFAQIDIRTLNTTYETEFYSQGELGGDWNDIILIHNDRCYIGFYKQQIGQVEYSYFDLRSRSFGINDIYSGSADYTPVEVNPFDANGITFTDSTGERFFYSFAD